jgi:4-diphosphocytidyl-2-C-methyl-D-erythritol kinase
LAFRAARLYLERWAPDSGVEIQLRKRIPIGGGLGGGSSNAATVLLGLRQIFREPTSAADLHELARQLGADVAFFLVGGTALGTGRGDKIAPLADLPEKEIWLATPPVSISTARIFADYDRLTAQGRISSMGPLALGEAIGWQEVERGRNDLEPVVLSAYPVVRDLYNALVRAGAREVRLTGSGATVVAWFDDPRGSAAPLASFPVDTRIVRTRTLTRASFQRLQVVE